LTARFDLGPLRAILLDIEGTATPIDFVYQVLSPYARTHLRAYLQQHRGSEAVRAAVEALRAEHSRDAQRQLNPPPWRDELPDSEAESVEAYVHWLMAQDRKATALKALQGLVWEAGYRKGELRSQVFPDVPQAFARWRRKKKDICIFSSGSILAQKLLFAHTAAGDLTPFIRTYFDTTTGAKTDQESYRRIAAAVELPAAEIAFLSDVVAELDAARLAGMHTALCARPGQPLPAKTEHPVIHSFDEIFP
jgi:enolase-phosphatase E1